MTGDQQGRRAEPEQRRREVAGRSDADQLAVLTGMPAGLWVAVFAMVALSALAVGALWLVQ